MKSDDEEGFLRIWFYFKEGVDDTCCICLNHEHCEQWQCIFSTI